MVSARAYSNIKRGGGGVGQIGRSGVGGGGGKKGRKEAPVVKPPVVTARGSLDPGWVVRPPVAPSEQVARGQQQ